MCISGKVITLQVFYFVTYVIELLITSLFYDFLNNVGILDSFFVVFVPSCCAVNSDIGMFLNVFIIYRDIILILLLIVIKSSLFFELSNIFDDTFYSECIYFLRYLTIAFAVV